MSKELTPLEALRNIKSLFIGSPINLSYLFDIIETAIKENEVHKYWLNEYIKIVHADLETTPLEFAKKVKLLEKIEKYLGLDIGTVFEALQHPIYVKEKKAAFWGSNRLYFGSGDPYIVITSYTDKLEKKDIVLQLSDYGKTWALTKEGIK